MCPPWRTICSVSLGCQIFQRLEQPRGPFPLPTVSCPGAGTVFSVCVSSGFGAAWRADSVWHALADCLALTCLPFDSCPKVRVSVTKMFLSGSSLAFSQMFVF